MIPLKFKPDNRNLKAILNLYLEQKPAFLSVIRAREATIFNTLWPLSGKSLDFGCGDGYFMKMSLIGSNYKIDYGLETDITRAKAAEISNVYKKILVYNGDKIPLANESINFVISNSVMEHLSNLENSVEEIFRILKKGDKFYVSVMSASYEDNLLGKIFLGKIYLKWMRKKAYHNNLLTKSEWRHVFKEAGFKIKKEYNYLDRNSTRLLDLLQYLSIPGIVFQFRLPFLSRIYFKFMKFIFGNLIYKTVINESHNDNCSAYFFILEK